MAPSSTSSPPGIVSTVIWPQKVTYMADRTVSEAAEIREDESETMRWIVICMVCILGGLGLATCQFLWNTYSSKESLQKRKEAAAKRMKKKEEKAIAAIKKEPIPVDQFLQRLRQKKLDKYLNFEVRAIVRNQEEYSCMRAAQFENIPKNVCQDVLPYDNSCVLLKDPPEGYDSDYINASYIEGCDGGKEYIATQGPRGKTVPAFWHMVWQERVHCIVMATGLFENSVQQCDKYWGDVLSVQKHVKQGDIHIFLDSILELSKLTIRTFHLQKDGCEESRVVKHFEMTGFTDDSTDPGFLLDVRRRVNKFMLTSSGPLLVHCRCGGGKTAVFIAIDFCLKQLEREKFVDIYSTVLYLRKFRQNMVRTLAQYRLIYDTLALHVQAWTTVVPSAQLPVLAHKLSLKDPYTHMTGFEREFKIFQDIVPNIPIGDCASGHRDENRNKSRDIMLLPPERARPYLQTMETHEQGTDFINAVFVDGYHQINKYAVTQWPMQSTINDIWRLLYDFKITSLVLLNDCKYSRNFPCFWPRDLDKEVKFGPIGVKYVGCQKYPHIIIRAFAIRKPPNTKYNSLLGKLGEDNLLRATCLPLIEVLHADHDSIIVKMFQYTSWHHRDKTPISTKSFFYMMSCVNDWQEANNSFKPICIMSKDGYSKCGVYCTLNICCEQLKSEREVDVFNAVRLVKQNRPQLIPTVNEYMYCYNYMSLLVEVMHEDTPRIVVNSPPNVIEGEIKQGYEQVTGFQNILSPYDEDSSNEKQSKHSHQNSSSVGGRLSSVGSRLSGVGGRLSVISQKNQRSSIEEPDDILQTSNNGLCSFDIGNKVSNNNISRGNPDRKYSRQSSATDTRHLRENGYLVENENVRNHRNNPVSAPKAPGRIRVSKSESDSFQADSNEIHDYLELRGYNSNRKILQRQNAEEVESPDVDIHMTGNIPDIEIHVFGNGSFESSCL